MYVIIYMYVCMYNNRLKFVYFIRLLLPPRSRINKYQIATNFHTNRSPLKLLIGLHVRREDKSYIHTLPHIIMQIGAKDAKDSLDNRDLSSRSPINSFVSKYHHFAPSKVTRSHS